MSFHKRLHAVYGSVQRTSGDMAALLVTYCWILWTTSMILHLEFGAQQNQFQSVLKTISTVSVSMFCGTFGALSLKLLEDIQDMGDMYPIERQVPVMMMLFGLPILLGWVLFSFVLAIVHDGCVLLDFTSDIGS